MTKKMTIGDFLTDAQLREAIKHGSAEKICEHVIKPNIAEINRKLGQENDPKYLAYAVEFALTRGKV